MLLESWEGLSAGPDLIRWIVLDAASEQPAALLESVLDGLHRRSATLSDEPPDFAEVHERAVSFLAARYDEKLSRETLAELAEAYCR